jgi:hypothetical protein
MCLMATLGRSFADWGRYLSRERLRSSPQLPQLLMPPMPLGWSTVM